MYSDIQFYEFYDSKNLKHHFDKTYTISGSKFDKFNQNLNLNRSQDEFENCLISAEEWKVEDLSLIEENVLGIKSRLRDYNLKFWSLHTNKFCLLNIHDCYSSFITFSNDTNYQQKPELFTRAWVKMYEILTKFNIKDNLVNNSDEINFLCLCEAPGAFVTSINHYFKLSSPECIINWMATSLNPYYEENDCHQDALTEDCFIEQTFEKWYFGKDNSGDIRQSNFHYFFKKEFEKSLGKSEIKIHLITCDGGINNIEAPEFQEINSFNLILNEAVVALNCLSNGGHLILKIFSFFNCKTISLIYFLVNVFEKVHLVKPISSKEGNSEIYLVCMHYHLDSNIHLIEHVTKRFERQKFSSSNLSHVILFKREKIPPEFIDELIECAHLFAQHQILSIKRNIYLFEKNDRNFYFKYKKLQKEIDCHFRQLVKLRPIKIDEQVVKKVYRITSNEKNYYYFGLNRKKLLKYDPRMSYNEIIAEKIKPEKKIHRIRLLVSSSVYLNSEKSVFEYFNKFHSFNHLSSMILNVDKFIRQPKNKSQRQKLYLNSQLCCVNLFKLYTDFDFLGKSISINDAQLTKKLDQNKKMILNQFKNLFSLESELLKTFSLINHIQINDQHSLSSLFVNVLENFGRNVKKYEHVQEFEETDIILHLIDLFNLNDEKILKDEHYLANILVLKLSEIVDLLKFNHFLIISLPSLYSRYIFGLIYLCSCLYNEFTISPFYLKAKNLRSGLLLIFTNERNHSKIYIDENFENNIGIKNMLIKDAIESISEKSIDKSDLAFSECDFKLKKNQVKNRILDCCKFAESDIQILDILGIHKLLRKKEYVNFLKLIILANNINIIETLKLKIDLSGNL